MKILKNRSIKKVILFTCFWCILNGPLMGQALLTNNILLYYYTPELYNPSYAGDNTEITLTNSKAYNNIDGAPNSVYITGGTPIKEKFGTGGIISYTASGPITAYDINAQGSYKLSIHTQWKLGLGLSLGYSILKLNKSKLYVNGTTTNEALLNAPNSTGRFSSSVGATITNGKFHGGISSIVTFIPTTDSIDVPNTVWNSFLNISWLFKVSYNLQISPQIMLSQITQGGISYSLGANAVFRKEIHFGVSYQDKISIAMQMGYTLKEKYTIGMSYGLPVGLLAPAGGSYFVSLIAKIGKETKTKEEKASFY